jgi:hypothetical protein
MVASKSRRHDFADLDKARGMDRKKSQESFIARIWLERGLREDSIWRGHVRHVQGEEETYFQDLGEMSEFLERVSGVSGLWPTSRAVKGTKSAGPGQTTEKNDK